jgi:Ca2+-transporting ATPase
VPLDESSRAALQVENEHMAGEALRVLGLAYKHLEEQKQEGSEAEENSGFIWLGMVGMRDPVRKGVKQLVGVLRGAGIETVMITGDQSPTAYAIAKEIELGREGQIEILDSTRLADLDPEVIKALSGKVEVFSRVSPKHKLQIVQALQSAGKVVAMTGDGINDGPALKAADIGIAMGSTGTDVAREIADVVVEDDNLETLIVAVSRGRTIYNNIRKSVHYLLATNTSEIMVMFAAISAGLGQPLTATQLLWINLISDIFPGISLALEAPEPDVLSRPPRKRNEPILKGSDFKRLLFEGGVISAGSLAAYGYGIARYGIGARASTIAFTSLATGQLLHAYSCRSETISIFDKEKLPPNKYLGWAVGGSLALQALTLIVPGLRKLIGTVPIGLADAGIVGATAVFPFFVNEATKGRSRKRQ